MRRCDRCNTDIVTGNYARHRRTCKGTRSTVCGFCHRSFPRHTHLTRHLKTCKARIAHEAAERADIVRLSEERSRLDAMQARYQSKLDDKDTQLNEKDAKLNEKDALLTEKDARIRELTVRNAVGGGGLDPEAPVGAGRGPCAAYDHQHLQPDGADDPVVLRQHVAGARRVSPSGRGGHGARARTRSCLPRPLE